MTHRLDPAIQAYYALGDEQDRLGGGGTIEAVRTRELLHRYLAPAPATVLDVGGAAGAYALGLAAGGYAVHLLDPWPPHVESARAGSAAQPGTPLASAAVGDARDLPYDDAGADAVLLLGPLYHLTDRDDRLQALREARRVLRPGGRLFAAAVSRFGSTLDGLATGELANPEFEGLVEGVLADGVHRNVDPDAHPGWFTLAYFHRPDELGREVGDAGFTDVELLAVEGPAGLWQGDGAAGGPMREPLLRAVRRVEREPSMLGASPHLMAVAVAP